MLKRDNIVKFKKFRFSNKLTYRVDGVHNYDGLELIEVRRYSLKDKCTFGTDHFLTVGEMKELEIIAEKG